MGAATRTMARLCSKPLAWGTNEDANVSLLPGPRGGQRKGLLLLWGTAGISGFGPREVASECCPELCSNLLPFADDQLSPVFGDLCGGAGPFCPGPQVSGLRL